MVEMLREATRTSDDGALMTCPRQAVFPKLSLSSWAQEEHDLELGERHRRLQTPADACLTLPELQVVLLLCRAEQAQLRKYRLSRALQQRAVVAGALGQSVVVAHQAPMAAISAIA